MYRLVLYFLLILWMVALIFSTFGILSFSPLSLIFSLLILTLSCFIVNAIFALVLKVPTNFESVFITALILFFILTPPESGQLFSGGFFLCVTATIAMASKYLLNISKKHIFNPVAIAVVVTAFGLNQSASWWVGTNSLFIFVLLGGILIVRKTRKTDVVLGFLIAATLPILVLATGMNDAMSTIMRSFISSPLIFFATVMLTEPLTLPPTRDGRIAYGILVGWFFSPSTHFGSLYFSPELALLAGNVFSYIVSPKGRFIMTLLEKKESAMGVYDFIFQSDKFFPFRPGQFMEWTLGEWFPDARGNRRFFTLASSPTESTVTIGIKFYDAPSSFKRKLFEMQPGKTIVASQLAGDFVLPDDPEQKLAFIAGGIGITPFRSMIQSLLDQNENRSIILLYSNKTIEEIAYWNLFDEVERRQLGLHTVYTLTDEPKIPNAWNDEVGFIDANMITRQIPDFKERVFYISGSHAMVTSFKKILRDLGVARNHIKTDFFPGLV